MDNRWDDLIFSETDEHWRKMARIISRVSDRVAGGPYFDEVAARVETLVGEGKLEAKGDLSRWRYSEVRRPQQDRHARA